MVVCQNVCSAWAYVCTPIEHVYNWTYSLAPVLGCLPESVFCMSLCLYSYRTCVQLNTQSTTCSWLSAWMMRKFSQSDVLSEWVGSRVEWFSTLIFENQHISRPKKIGNLSRVARGEKFSFSKYHLDISLHQTSQNNLQKENLNFNFCSLKIWISTFVLLKFEIQLLFS